MFNLLLFLLPLSHLADATPLKHDARQQSSWNPPYTRCATCFLSSWTQGPECTTDKQLQSTISRILNPPPQATSTYTPSQWCSDYLRRTDWSTTRTTTSAVSTYTSWTIEHLFVTVTDYDHPTSTMYCPIPSSGMECGWDSNTVAPWKQGQDFSVEKGYNAAQCHQICLSKPACKAYRLQDGDSSCEIFNVGLGQGASNVINPTPSGSQWWDRNCQKHAPTPCKTATAQAASTTKATSPRAVIRKAAPAQPLVTSLPTLAPRAEAAHIQKRDAELPKYLDDLLYFWSSIFVEPACSCVVSSALPPTSATTTSTITSWTATTTISETYEDWFTVTETPRKTTIYRSVN